ncbi:slipin family protein, partial [Escherichia coli]
FGLRAAVGTRTLDELLENKQSIDEAVSAHLAAKLEDSGLEVSGLGVRDIILPGEM